LRDESKYYLQDSRSYVGNDIIWHAKDGGGYTTDLRRAEVFSEGEAFKLNSGRETDIPWPKEYIDCRTRPAVDMQGTNIKKALKGTGMKLAKQKKRRRPVINCRECGKFISEYDTYNGCPHCGSDNCP